MTRDMTPAEGPKKPSIRKKGLPHEEKGPITLRGKKPHTFHFPGGGGVASCYSNCPDRICFNKFINDMIKLESIHISMTHNNLELISI